MSLEAVVYKNTEQIKQSFPGLKFCIDTETGESYPPDNVNAADYPQSDFAVAEQRWLGNLNSIAAIRSAFSGCKFQGPVINRILESGSQCGEYIEVLEFPQLKTEIETYLKSVSDASIIEFLKSILDLLNAGEKENNPIVFV